MQADIGGADIEGIAIDHLSNHSLDLVARADSLKGDQPDHGECEGDYEGGAVHEWRGVVC